MKIIAIDFDGTIVEDAYPAIGELNPGAEFAINLLFGNSNNYIIINTCRKGKLLLEMVNFLALKAIRYHRINDNAPWLIEQFGNTRKIHADVFIDANNVGGMPHWDKIPKLIDKQLPY